MLSRIAVRARPLMRQTNVRYIFNDDWVKTHPKEIFVTFKKTLNDLPVPAGSWQESYEARNRKWNIMLAASVTLFASVMALMWKLGSWNLHYKPNYKTLDIDPTVPMREKYPDKMPAYHATRF